MKVLNDERRCRKAVNWGAQDKKLRNIFVQFLTGTTSYSKLPRLMAWHYIRCKIKEKLGMFSKPLEDKIFEEQLKEARKNNE